MQYIKLTINDKRIMGADGLIQLCTWVNAVYGLHTNLKIHNGSCMSFEYGVAYCKSRNHKLNTNSSNESEVVVVSGYLPHNIWIFFFMRA